MTDRDWGLTPEEAIARLQEESEREDRHQEGLDGIPAQDVFWLGFQTAIHRYGQLTGPNPVESKVVYYDDLPVGYRQTVVDGEPAEEPIYTIDVSEKKEHDQ